MPCASESVCVCVCDDNNEKNPINIPYTITHKVKGKTNNTGTCYILSLSLSIPLFSVSTARFDMRMCMQWMCVTMKRPFSGEFRCGIQSSSSLLYLVSMASRLIRSRNLGKDLHRHCKYHKYCDKWSRRHRMCRAKEKGESYSHSFSAPGNQPISMAISLVIVRKYSSIVWCTVENGCHDRCHLSGVSQCDCFPAAHSFVTRTLLPINRPINRASKCKQNTYCKSTHRTLQLSWKSHFSHQELIKRVKWTTNQNKRPLTFQVIFLSHNYPTQHLYNKISSDSRKWQRNLIRIKREFSRNKTMPENKDGEWWNERESSRE